MVKLEDIEAAKQLVHLSGGESEEVNYKTKREIDQQEANIIKKRDHFQEEEGIDRLKRRKVKKLRPITFIYMITQPIKLESCAT